MKIVLILFGIFLLCPQSKATLFTIKKGEHYSSQKPIRVFAGKKMDISVTFDESAFYQFTGDAVNDQIDTNKLYGFSDCKSVHTQNSARFGWRDHDGKIEIMAFTHRNGSFFTEPVTMIEPNQTYNASISISEDNRHYIYDFNGIKTTVQRGCDDHLALGYHLFPYFGGNQSAPHDVTIKVDVNEETGPAFADLPYPNIVHDRQFKMKVNSYAQLNFYLKLYNTLGQLVWKSEKVSFQAEQKILTFQIQPYLASGMYFIVPITQLPDGTELRAGITNRSPYDSFKIMIIH